MLEKKKNILNDHLQIGNKEKRKSLRISRIFCLGLDSRLNVDFRLTIN